MSWILKWQGFRRCNTRSVQYNWKDVERVLKANQPQITYHSDGLFFHATAELPTKEAAVAFRAKMDRELRSVHPQMARNFEAHEKTII